MLSVIRMAHKVENKWQNINETIDILDYIFSYDEVTQKHYYQTITFAGFVKNTTDDYEFEIADGVFVSGAVEPITYEQFCEEMVGSAWAADLSSARLILEDGSIDNKPHYELQAPYLHSCLYLP